jgi:hypothetical protein
MTLFLWLLGLAAGLVAVLGFLAWGSRGGMEND